MVHHARARRLSAESASYLYYCPHGEDKVHVDKRGCQFQGTLDAVTHHLEVCKYEAAEVRQLADSIASYLRKKPGCATEVASIIRTVVERLANKDLDERHVEVHDTLHTREITVKGLDVQPLMIRFAQSTQLPKKNVNDAWQEFLRYCLPGFRPICLPHPRRKGGRLLEDMLEAQLKDVEGEAQQGFFSEDLHSYRVWSLAIQSAEAAAAVSLEMGSTSPDIAIAAIDQSPLTAKILESAAIGGGSDLMKVLHIFRQWDTDHNGSISKEELAELLIFLDSGFKQADLDRLFSAADMNHDNSIDYAEFVAWLLK